MDHAAPLDPADAGQITLPDAVWDEIRADYLAGWSAPACCRRYGVGLSTFRKRAAEESWRRVDQPWTGPRGLERDDEGLALEESVDGDLEKVGLGELAVVAFQRMMRAVLHGDAMAALRWRRVHQVLDAEHRRLTELRDGETERRRQAERRRYRAATDALMLDTRLIETDNRHRAARLPPLDDLDAIDDIDGVFPRSPDARAAAFTLPGLPVGKSPTGPP